MFRVSKAQDPSRTIITVDGQLAGECIDVVEICCDQEISTGKPVHLLLRDLTTIDQAGRALLSRLAARGVRLLASGVYTSYIVHTLSPTKDGDG